MVRIQWLLRRKPGISFDQFRTHYERSHAVLGAHYFGHLMTGYRRNYVLPVELAADAGSAMARVLAIKGWDYDCVAEWDLIDEAAFDQVVAMLADPVIGKIFHDDEEHFLDRSSVRLVRYETCETDTSACQPPERQVAPAQGASLWD